MVLGENLAISCVQAVKVDLLVAYPVNDICGGSRDAGRDFFLRVNLCIKPGRADQYAASSRPPARTHLNPYQM